jgi:thiol-activated cytolysin
MKSVKVRRHLTQLILLFALIMTTVPVSVASAAERPSIPAAELQAPTTCSKAVQGKIAWDYAGHTQWTDANLRALCKDAEESTEPARCFQQVMHGGVNWGGGTRWQWTNALDLCESTPDAARTIQCFESAIRNQQSWQAAIASCDERAPVVVVGGSSESQAINRYIESLHYNRDQLLRVQPAGSTSSTPVVNRTNRGSAINICTQVNHSLRSNVDDVAILDPNAGVIFPGALLLANQELADGHPQSLALPRGAATFTVNLPGLPEPSFVVTSPSFSTVKRGLNRKLDEWNRTARSQGYRNPALSSLIVEEAYSSQQVAVALGLNAEWVTGSKFDSVLNVNHDSSTETAFALYRQVFYRVTMDQPGNPAAVFADSVTARQVQAKTNAGQPPAYVRSVDYGRLLLIKMEVAKSKTDVDMEATFTKMLAAAEVSGSIDSSYSETISNAKFTVAAIGGNAENAAQFSGSRQDIERLGNYIQRGASYSVDNPGVPIAYTVAFLKDGQLARMGFGSDYSTNECVEYPNGYVKISHDGAYVATFRVTWQEPNGAGAMVTKSWPKNGRSSGKTSGYVKQVDLPGDATNIRIQAWVATGLVWQPWSALKIDLNSPTNACYRFGGTTLNNWWDTKNKSCR